MQPRSLVRRAGRSTGRAQKKREAHCENTEDKRCKRWDKCEEEDNDARERGGRGKGRRRITGRQSSP
jgi:hypothetical protein